MNLTWLLIERMLIMILMALSGLALCKKGWQ